MINIQNSLYPLAKKSGLAPLRLLLAALLIFFFLAGSETKAEDREKTSPPPETVRGFSYDHTDKEKAFIQSTPLIRVSNEFDWPPFDFVANGKPAGFGIELMDLLAEKSGLTFTYVNGYTWDELTQMFFEGKLDILHSMSITPERQKKALFSAPYYHSKHVLIYRSDTRDVHTLNDLEGKIIAMPRGWSTIEFFKTHYPRVHIIEVESTRQALEYVDQGKVAATVEQEGIALYLLNKFGFTDLVLSKWLDNDELQKTSSMHFAVLKTHPVLFSILNKAQANITTSEMLTLKEKWFSRAGRSIGAEDVGLTPEERSWLADKKQLFYCIAQGQMPYSAVKGTQPMGMLPDLAEIFSERLGIEFVPYPVPEFNTGPARLLDGSCDLIPMISKTGPRQNHLDFTAAYNAYDIAVIAREDSPFIAGIPDLDRLKTGMVTSSNIFEKVMSKYPKLNYIPADNIEDCLEQVSSGRLDAAVLSLPMASYYIRKKGLANLKVAGHTGIKEDLRIAVPKDGGSPLHSILSKAVRSLTLQELETIDNKWISIEMAHQVDYTLLWQIAGGAGFILIMVILWNRKLARLNREVASANKKLRDKTRELEYISTRDSLTNLYNRRHIEEAFETERLRALRYKHDLALIILDIDYFKAINDTYGHQVGDGVLRTFANRLKTNIRATDILGRWGGEEFIIVCPEINRHNAVLMARGLCRKIGQTPFDTAGTQTASFGVTALKTGDDIQAMVSRADHALYQAKSNGRNRVESIE